MDDWDIVDDENQCFCLKECDEDEIEVVLSVDRKALENQAIDLVKTQLYKFFKDREIYYGGPIPSEILFSEDNIRMVLTTKRETGISIAHAMMDRSDEICSVIDVDTGMSCSIEKIIEICNICDGEKVPPQFMGGIIVLYLELVEGISALDSSDMEMVLIEG